MDTNATLNRLVPVMTAMINHWHDNDEKACLREFMGLEVDDRRLVEESFRLARKNYPTREARAVAKGIHRMIKRNLRKEVDVMMEVTEKVLWLWIKGDKKGFLTRYLGLGQREREMFLDGIKEVFADSEAAEFRQAVVDIPIFLRAMASKNQPDGQLH